MKKSRKLKIQPHFINRTYDQIKVPKILLKGKWLEDAGFKSGQIVQIQQDKNKLIITLAN